MKNPVSHSKDIYQRGNDYDQEELLTSSPCGAYVTIEMFNQVISKLIILIKQKQDELKLGYINYEDEKYLHDVNDDDIFSEVARKAIEDEFGDNIEQTYLKKSEKPTYQTDEDGNIIAINNIPIAAATGSLPLKGEDGVYVRNDLTANIVGISADFAYNSAMSGKQDKLADWQLANISDVENKLDIVDFNQTISSYATKQYVNDKIADIGTPLVIRGSKTCSEIEALTNPKVGDVYCVTDTGTIHQSTGNLDVIANDEVAYTTENGWIVIGREVAVDLSDYYKKTETSGAGEISTALNELDNKFNDYYTKDETSGANEISSAIANKADASALTSFYTKNETSSKEELNSAFSGKADVSTLNNYVTNNTLTNNYYNKTETDTLIESATSSLVDYSYLQEHYYNNTETSSKNELSSAFNNKLDVTAFNASSTQWNESYDVVSENSAKWNEGTGDEEVNALVHSNSGAWNDVSSKVDTSALASILDYYVTEEYLTNNYYDKTDTSSKEEISGALNDKLDTTAFNISATAWNDTTDVVRANSASWVGGGDTDVNQLVHENSGVWNDVSSKLDTTAFSTVSGTFLTAHQDLSYISGVIDDKLDASAFDPNDYYPMTGNPSGFLTEHQSLDNYYTKAETYNKEEVEALLNGKIVVLPELPEQGESGIIYYIGPTGTGDDKYDEYIWNNEWIQVGEHSINLSGYATEDDIAEVYEYVDTSLDDKLDTTAIGVSSNIVTGISGYAIKDTTYTQGDNINITNNVISGKDWSGEIDSAIEDLSEEMVENFSKLDENKLDISSFSTVSGTFLTAHQDLSEYLTKTSADTLYQPIGDYATTSQLDEKVDITDFNNTISAINSAFDDYDTAIDNIIDDLNGKQDALTNEQLSAISSVSSFKGTILTGDSNIRATSSEVGNNTLWTLELTAQPVVTDTTLSGYSGVVATKDSTVSSQWNVGLSQDYVSAISSLSSIPTITKQDVDDIWAIVTAERGQ